jgi:predicted ester cyclase
MIDAAQLRRFAEQYTAAWCSQDAASVAACYANNGSLSVNSGPPAVGRDAITATAQGFMTTFPDLKVLMDSLECDGSRAIYRWTLEGTSAGTRKGVRISGFEQWQMSSECLIEESRGHFDSVEYQRQLQRGVDEESS